MVVFISFHEGEETEGKDGFNFVTKYMHDC